MRKFGITDQIVNCQVMLANYRGKETETELVSFSCYLVDVLSNFLVLFPTCQQHYDLEQHPHWLKMFRVLSRAQLTHKILLQ